MCKPHKSHITDTHMRPKLTRTTFVAILFNLFIRWVFCCCLSLPQIVLAITFSIVTIFAKVFTVYCCFIIIPYKWKNNSQSHVTPNCYMKGNLCCFQILFVACIWHSVYTAFHPDLLKSRHCNPILKYHRYTNIHTSFIVISALPQIKSGTYTLICCIFFFCSSFSHCHLKVYHSQWWLSTIAWQKVIASSQPVHFGGVFVFFFFLCIL